MTQSIVERLTLKTRIGYGIGDIAICSELIREEATSQGKKINHHLIHIFVHGVLHLLGFDHDQSSNAEKTESLEVRILSKIGVADPY